MDSMLVFEENLFGIPECELDLAKLFPDKKERLRFDGKLQSFLASDPTNSEIYFLKRDALRYYTESFISNNNDGRPPLLLLLGNPASHSTAAGMCFAFEGSRREHRFWKALRETELLDFLPEQIDPNHNYRELNNLRKQALLNLDYISPFRVGIAVFYSMPSPASDQKWSGVNGLRRLLGQRALNIIAAEEEKRIARILDVFMKQAGGIIVFQRDAYNNLISQDSLPYSLNLALQGSLIGKYKRDSRIPLVGSPPTRRLRGESSMAAFRKCKDFIINSTMLD
jgi:hypothetical protein